VIERLHLSAIILAAAVTWGVLLLLEGVAVSPSWFHPFSTVVAILMLLLAAFDLWLWRLSLLRGWLVKRPFIAGTWCTEVRSNWKDLATGEQIPPLAAFIVIRQTFSSLTLCLITDESRSELAGAEVVRSADGTYRVFGVYTNEPRFAVRARSPMHYGGLELRVAGSPPERIEGHYWTDRNTAGELSLSNRKRSYAHDMASATRLYG
jgi:predicted pore-forming effector associated with SMODS systems